MAWDPGQYLKFASERLRPALDLLARVPLAAPRTIVDLGCGAGNVTRILAERWPDAEITGIDNSPAMLEQARAALLDRPRVRWVEADVAGWSMAASEGGADLVYSNAALHWLPDHAQLFPRLLKALARGGVLAVQMPSNFAAPSHVALAEIAASARWRGHLGTFGSAAPVAEPQRYFDWLAPQAQTLDLWTTEYLHVLAPTTEGEHPVVAWMKGTALTPYIARLDAADQAAFVAEYRARINVDYPRRADGRVLFPFRRLFIVASC